MNKRPIVVLKVGGDMATSPERLQAICAETAVLKESGFSVILVHGGGPQLDQALQRLGQQSTRVAGRRVTASADLELAIQVWRGTLSVAWVSGLSRQGVAACGVCGADGSLLQGHRRPRTSLVDDNGHHVTVDFGHVGDLDRVDASLLFALLQSNIVPVISPLAMDPVSGRMLNVNADTVAAAVACAVQAEWLVLLSSVPGLLRDVEDPTTRVSKMAVSDVPDLIKSGVITGGMRPKIAALADALAGGVHRAILLDGRVPQMSKVLVRGQDSGTELFTQCKEDAAVAV